MLLFSNFLELPTVLFYYYFYLFNRYLNNQHIKTNKLSEAELIYGNHHIDDMEQMEIGELGEFIFGKNFRHVPCYSFDSFNSLEEFFHPPDLHV